MIPLSAADVRVLAQARDLLQRKANDTGSEACAAACAAVKDVMHRGVLMMDDNPLLEPCLESDGTDDD